jgi:hypothetical protein
MASLLDLPDDCLERVISFLPPRDTLFSVSASLPSPHKTLTKDPYDPFYSACNRLHQITLRSLIQDIVPRGETSLSANLFTKIFKIDPSSLKIDTPGIFFKIKILWKVCRIYSEGTTRFSPHDYTFIHCRFRGFSEFDQFHTSQSLLDLYSAPLNLDNFCSTIIVYSTVKAAKIVRNGEDIPLSPSQNESHEMVLLRSLKPSLTVPDYRFIFETHSIMWGAKNRGTALRLVKCLMPDSSQSGTALAEAREISQVVLRALEKAMPQITLMRNLR